MNSTSIGLTILSAGQRGLALTGQNIANAGTVGYHRQTLNLASMTVDGVRGAGVDVASITRYEVPAARTAILRGNGDREYATARLNAQQQVEAALGTSPGTIGDGLEAFFNAAEELTAHPESTALRRTTLAAASDVANQLKTAAGDIDRLRADVGTQIGRTVDEVNDFATRIAALNTRIASVEQTGAQANDLRDQRDGLVNELSKRMDVRIVPQPFGVVNVLATNAPVVVGEFANSFATSADAAGNMVVTQAGSSQPLKFSGGSLGGQLQTYNQDLTSTRSRLDGLAREFITRVNAVQATGIGAGGPVTAASAGVSVGDPTAPLAAQGLPATPTAGTLTISLTNAGTRTNVAIPFDPATQSLNDLAAAITAGTGGAVQGGVDPQTNQLTLQAQAGYSFDFAGRAPTTPPGGAAVPNPDTGGLLPALGLNGLFQGSDATTIAVRPEFTADPGRLAVSRTGQPADATNLERLAAVRDQPVAGGRTLAGEFSDLAATVGQNVQLFSDQSEAQAAALQNMSDIELSVTGVDTNEELVHLLDYQRMIDAGSKYLSVVNSALDKIMEIIR